MPDPATLPRPARTLARAAQAPLGILLLAAVLAMLGLGTIAGAVYLFFEARILTLWAVLSAGLLGPAALYLAYHLVRVARWAWLALVVLVGLMFLSTLVRIFLSPGLPLPALVEISAEAAVLYYLARPGLRERFGWGAR